MGTTIQTYLLWFPLKNYPCDSHIRAYFGIPEDDLSAVGIEAFSKQLYMCLMAQTLWMKGEIESRRSQNYLGTTRYSFCVIITLIILTQSL